MATVAAKQAITPEQVVQETLLKSKDPVNYSKVEADFAMMKAAALKAAQENLKGTSQLYYYCLLVLWVAKQQLPLQLW